MKKILIIVCLFFTTSVRAQMVDLLSGLSVQGVLTQQSTQSASRGLSQLQKTQILSGLNQASMEIKTRYLGNYNRVSNNSVSGHYFNGINYQIGSSGSSEFFIQLNQIDESTCSYLISMMRDAEKIFVNGHQNKTCQKNNSIKFIFK